MCAGVGGNARGLVWATPLPSRGVGEGGSGLARIDRRGARPRRGGACKGSVGLARPPAGGGDRWERAAGVARTSLRSRDAGSETGRSVSQESVSGRNAEPTRPSFVCCCCCLRRAVCLSAVGARLTACESLCLSVLLGRPRPWHGASKGWVGGRPLPLAGWLAGVLCRAGWLWLRRGWLWAGRGPPRGQRAQPPRRARQRALASKTNKKSASQRPAGGDPGNRYTYPTAFRSIRIRI